MTQIVIACTHETHRNNVTLSFRALSCFSYYSLLYVCHAVHILYNVMQNSAISFSICVDFRDHKIMKLIEDLSKNFEVYYNTGLTLITIKNYDSESFNTYRTGKGIMLEQSSRSTLQVLIKH